MPNRVPPHPGGPTPTPTPRPVEPLPDGVSPADYLETQVALWEAEDQNDTVVVSDMTKWVIAIATELRAAEL